MLDGYLDVRPGRRGGKEEERGLLLLLLPMVSTYCTTRLITNHAYLLASYLGRNEMGWQRIKVIIPFLNSDRIIFSVLSPLLLSLPPLVSGRECGHLRLPVSGICSR